MLAKKSFFYAACVFNHESTKSEAIVIETTKKNKEEATRNERRLSQERCRGVIRRSPVKRFCERKF